MRQILYVSPSAAPGDKADLVGILKQSRHNNAIDGAVRRTGGGQTVGGAASMLNAPARKIVDLRLGEPHANAGLSLKAAFGGTETVDVRIEALLRVL